MNAPVLLAQLAGSPAQTPASPKNLKIEKPQNGQAVTVHLDGTSKLDLADIASEKLTFVRVGEKLVILFDNQSTVTVDPVFDNNGRPVTDLAFDMGADRTLSGEQFAQAFPITTDQSVLPAAGGATGPTGGASFSDASVTALGASGARLGLLGNEDGAGGFATDVETQANATPIPGGVTSVILNEDGFAEGNLGGSGDVGGTATSVTGSLNVNFGTDSVGRSFVFNADQPGLQGLTSGGQSVQLAIVNVGGVPTLIGYVGTDSSVAANQVFTVTLNVTDTGDTYTFNLLRPLDHSQPGTIEETLNLTISVTAIDGSSDTAPVTIQIGINDDTPTIGVPAGVTVIDPLDSASSVQSGSLGISWGSDRFNNTVDGGVSGSTGGNGDRSVVFTSAVVGVSGASANAESVVGALTSNGETVRYVVLANGTTLVAYTGDTVPALPGSEVGSNIVFVVTLSDASDTGSYTITQYQPLDHVSGGQTFSSIDLSFQFTARDSDGDPVSGNFTVRVTDTAPTVGEAVAAQNVGEDGLPSANLSGGSYDAADNASLSNIALNINWGADNDTRGNSAGDVYGRTLSFLSGGETQNPLGAGNASSLALVITGENGAVLTSGGVELQYVVTVNANGGETLTAYKGTPGESNAVFTVTLDPTSPNGSYSFTLLGQLDHASESNSIGLTFTVQAADADGDTINTSFTVNVQDDTPVAHTVTAATTLDDEAQTLFPGNNTPADGVPNASVAQGIAGTLFTAGADGTKSVTISGGAFDVVYKDANGFAQTESVTWGAGVADGNGNTTFTATSDHYTGSEGSTVAAKLVIGADGSYTYTAYAPVVQSTPTSGANQIEENTTIKIDFVVTDGDGDTSAGSLSVNVNDDTPVAHVVTASTVLDDEAQTLFTPTNSGGLGDVSPNVNSVIGTAGSLFTAGADGVKSVVLSTAPSFDVIYKDALGFAQKESVTWGAGVTDANGNTTFTATSAHYTGENNTGVAAKLVVGADGSYSLTLFAPVAHDVKLPGIEENKTLSFGVTVTDGDGDQATATLRVRVNDDTPAPIASIVVAAHLLDDEAQGLFPGNDTPDDGVANNKVVTGAAGTLFSMGADGLGSLSVALPTFSVIYAEGGFAKTESVSWSAGVRSADGTTTFTATSTHYSGSDGSGVAATLVIKADGSYSFSLGAPLVQSGNGEDNKVLTFLYTVTDGDGDPAGGSLFVTVNDDVPVAKVVTAATVLDDEKQTVFPGNAGGNGDVDNANVATGGVGALFSAGADGVRSVTISANQSFVVVYKDGNGFALTETATWTKTGTDASGHTTFTASSAHYANAATLVIGADGSYTFTVNAPVVQGTATSGANPVEENTTITVNFTVTDGDGDSASGSLSVNVNDDTPVAHSVTTAKLDDEAQTLFTPTNNGGLGDVSPNINSVTGAAGSLFTAGSDGVRSVTLAGPVFNVIYKDALGFAQIEGVTWGAGSKGIDGTTTFIATGATSNQTVATLIVGADGSYKLTVSAPVAHDIQLPAVEENKTLTFGITVTDGDGDHAMATLRVDVNDDTPVPVASIVFASQIMDDEAQTLFTPVNNGGIGDVSPNVGTVSGGAGTLFNMGADGLGSLSVGLPSFNAIYQVGGFAKVESVDWSNGVRSADGVTTFTATGHDSHQTVATLVIKADGSYSFTLSAPVAHDLHLGFEETQSLIFTYTAKDGDGDAAVGSLSVSVNDDTPTAKVVTASTVLDDEAQSVFPGNAGGAGDVDNANVAHGDAGALFSAGADGVRSVTIAANQSFGVVYKDANGFAQTETATWSKTGTDSNGNTTFTATSSHYATAATLVIGADGSYTFTVNAPVVQGTATSGANPTEENKTITVNFTVTDGDGDTASGSLSVRVNDDTPIAHSITAATILDDEAQSVFAGNAGGAGDVDNANVATGGVGALFSAGADGVKSVTISGGAFDVVYKDGGFAKTESVTWGAGVTDANGNTTFTAKSTHYTGTGGSTVAATLVIGADGSYTFSVFAPVVQATATSGANPNEENKTIKINFTVTDGDGDTAAGSLSVDVNDDTPIAKVVVAATVLDDEKQTLFLGNAGGNGDVEDASVASGSAGTLFTAGADGVKSVTISGGAFDVVYKDGGFAKTESVTWGAGVTDANGNTTFTAKSTHYTGTGGSTVAATLVIGADGSYTFSVFAPVVQATATSGANPTEENKTIKIDFTVTDGDGDTAAGSLSVNVNDDTPVAKVVTAATVLDDEAQTIFAPNAGGVSGDVTPDTNTVSGAAGSLFTAGADDVKSVSMTSATFGVIYKDANGFAQTETATWGSPVVGANGSTTWTATSAHYTSGAAVLVINADGSYSFTVNAPLVHPTNSATEENKALTFNFTVTDGDGDTAAGSLTVNVNDDTVVLGTAVAGFVDEGNLAGGNKDNGYPGDLTVAQGDNGTRSTSGSLAIAFGADGKAATVTGGTQTQTFTFSGNNTLTPDLVVTQGTVNHGSAPGIVFGGINNPIVINANDSLPFKLDALDLGLSGAPTTPTVILKGYDANNNLIATYTLTVANVASLVSGTPTHFDAAGTPFANLLIDKLEIYTGVGFSGYVMADNLVVTQNTSSGPMVVDAAVTFTDHSNGQANLIVKDANGNDVTASLKSNGEAVHYAMIDAVTLIGYTGTTAPTSLTDARVVFSAVLSSASANGSYTFTQNATLDHPIAGQDDDLVFTFNFTAKDGDGDKANGHFTVTVDDDAPTLSNPAVGANLIVNGQFLDNTGFAPLGWGGDAATGSIQGWAITGAALERNPSGWYVTDPVNGGRVVDLDASPGNVTLTQTLTNLTAGESYTLSFDAAKPAGFSAKAEVWWNGQLVGTIDPTSSFQQFSFTFTAISGTNTLEFREVGIADNGGTFLANVQLHASSSIVDEDALSGGNVGGQGDAPGTAIATGSLGINWGADNRDVADANGLQDGAGALNSVTSNVAALTGRAVYFTDSDSVTAGLQPAITATAGSSAITLTSQGQVVKYQVLENGTAVVGYTGTFDATNTSNWVFKASLSDDANGSYKFTLLKPIDHPVSGSEDDVTLQFGFTARDADGDTVSGTFSITIDDDTPVLIGAAASVTVDETNTPFAQASFGSLNIGFGADKVGAHLDFAVDGNGQPLHPVGLTSDGVALNYVLRTTEFGEKQLVAFKVGDTVDNPVFIVALSSPANPTYIFTLFQNLDHAINSDTLGLNFTIRATDGDGDFVDRTISVNVLDSHPTIPATQTQRAGVSDDALAGGNPEAGDSATASGTLSFDFGADSNGHLSWISATLPTGGYSSTLNGNVFEVYQLQNGVNVKIFAATLNPITGEYTIEQFAAVHHPNGNGEQGEGFNLIYRVTDGDGDYVESYLRVVVGDDVPVIIGNAEQINLLTNGDFSGGTGWHDASYGAWATGATGWKITGTEPGQAGVQLERIPSGYFGVVTSNGEPMVDLGASPGNIAVSQTLSGLTVGQHYTLSFEIGTYDPASSGLEVYWNGQLVGTYAPGSTMAIQTLDLIAASGENTVTFKEVGNASDNTGTYLANVSLVQAGQGALPVFHADISEDGTSVVTLASGTDFRFGADGPGAVIFNTANMSISTPTGTVLGLPTVSYDPVTGKLTIAPGWGFNGLSEGEVATLSIPFTVTDSDGDTKAGVYQFTIHGTNDAISTSPGFPETGTITEYVQSDPRAGSSVDRTEFDAPPGYAGPNGGGFWIRDDQGDTHTVDVTPQASGYVGYLTAFVSQETAGNVNGDGFVTWNYHVTDAQLNFLSAGETKTEIFRILVSDGHGSSAYRDITVTLVGTNDRPDIFVGQNDSSAVSLQETNSSLTAHGTLTVADVDHLDNVSATVSGVTWTLSSGNTMYSDQGLLDMFALSSNTPLVSGGQRSAALGWTFNSNGSAFNFLGEGVTATLTYTVEVTDGIATDTQTVTVTITGTNDAPTIALPATLNVSEVLGDSSAQDIAAISGSIVVTDADRGDVLHLSTTGNAVATLSGGGTLPSGVDISALINSSAVTFSADQISSAGQRTFTWTYDPQAANLDWLAQGQTLTIVYPAQVSDGHATAGTSLTIVITGTNDAPVLSVTGSATTYVEVDGADSYGTFVFAGLNTAVTDADAGASFSKVTLTIVNMQSGDDLNMFTTPGQRVLSDGTHINYTTAIVGGQLTMTFTNALTGGTLTAAEVDEAIKTLVRFHTGDRVAFDTPDRLIDVTVYDDLGAASNVVRVTLGVQGTNDTPTWANASLAASIDEDHSFSLNEFFTSQALKVSDRDADGDAKLILHVDHGTLSFAAASGVTVTYDPGAKTYTLTGTMAQINNLLVAVNGVKYTPDANYHGTDALTLTFSDNGDLGLPAKQAVATIDITINSVNDAPVISVSGTTTGYVEVDGADTFGTYVFSSTTTSVSDVDSNTFSKVTIAITNAQSGDSLNMPTSAGQRVLSDGTQINYSTATVGGQLTMTFTNATQGGMLTSDEINEAIKTLVRFHTGDRVASDTPDRIVEITVYDETNVASNVASVTLHVQGTNDTPTWANAALTASVDEDNSFSLNQFFNSNTLKVSDRDADGDAKLSLHVDHGTLTIASAAGVSVTYDPGTNTYTLTGTMAQLNNLLVAVNGVKYTPDANYHGTDALTLTFSDNGDLGLAAKQAVATITIDVASINDKPVITSDAAAAQGAVIEAGDLALIREASVGGPLQLAASLAGNATVVNTFATLDGLVMGNPLPPLPTLADVQAAITAIASVSDMPTAIAAVWQHLDAIYASVGADKVNVNAAFTMLGVAYADYLKAGGMPLVDVIAKFTADGPDADTLPERLQSLHDNLLGNVTDYALHQRYDAVGLYTQMHDLVAAHDATVLTRSPQPVTGNASDPAGLASDAHASDMAHGQATHVSGQLTASDVDGDTLAWSISGTSSYGVMVIDAATGKWTYTLDDTLTATQALGAGDSVTETFTAIVDDGHGGSVSQVVTITIKGTNDAPVLTHAAADAAATIYAGGGLDHVATADVTGDHKFEIDQSIDSKIADLLAATPDNMHTVLLGVQAALGHAAGFADAIAAVWDYVDDHYSYYNTVINAVGVRLAVEYAKYVQDGGEPLTGIVVKYAPDGGDAGTAPDRVQSMHDNLLGNLDAVSMIDKFLDSSGGGSNGGANGTANPTLYTALINEISAAGLSGRPYFGGYENENANPAHDWDAAHGLLPGGTHQVVSGQLTATDIDTNDAGQLTWSLNTTATPYGTMSIDAATGKWTYDLDNSLTATRALGANQTVTESFIATVTDGHGGSASQTIVITIKGTNDAPEIHFNFDGPYTSAEDTPVHLTKEQIDGFIAQYVSDADDSNASLVYTYSIGGQSITFTGSAPAGGFTFTPDANFHGVLNGFFSVSDGLATTTKTFTYNVTAVNDAPTLSNVGSVTVAEDTTLYLKTAGWVADDVDRADGRTPVVTLTLNVTSGDGVLSAISNGLSGYFEIVSSNNGKTLTITTHDDGNSRDAYAILNSLLRGDNFSETNKNGIAFTPGQDFNGPVTVSYSIDDHGSYGAAGSSVTNGNFSINVTPVNDAPVMNSATLTISEGGTVSLVAGSLSVTDPDSTSFTYTVSNVTHGNFQVLSGGNWINATSFTSANVNGSNVRFVHDGGEAAPTFSIKANDGALDSSVIAGTVNFTNVNDAPTLSGLGGTLSYTEHTSAKVIDNTLSISDVDNTTLASATVKITSNYQSGLDVLSVTTALPNGVTSSFDASTGTLTLTGAASLAQYETLLESVAFSNASTNASLGDRTITYTINDGSGGTASGTATVTVVKADDGDASLTLTDSTPDTPPTVGDTLTATIGTDPDGGNGSSVTYKWYRDGNTQISGASSSTYTLTGADSGHTITVKASYTDGQGYAETVSSTASAVVQGLPLTVNDTSDASGRYAMSRDSASPNAISLNASSLFSGGTGTVIYSYQLVSGASSTNWLTITAGGLISGNPSNSHAGEYIYKVTATDSMGSVSTYVALTVLPDLSSGKETVSNDASAGDLVWSSWLSNDVVTFTGANPTTEANASFGIDVMLGQSGINRMNGGDGDDALYGMAGNDILAGGDGDDFIDGGAGNDVITGGAGDDTLVGGSGDDTFNYVIGDGADIVDGGAGNDTLAIKGTSGGNTLAVVVAGGVITQFNGGAVVNVESVTADLLGGNDTLSYAGTTAAIAVDLATGTATGFTSIANIENITGGSGDDTLTGNGGANVIEGGNGNDTIRGGAGDDTLNGGAGNDTYVFGLSDGNDTINETSGADRIRIVTAGAALTSLNAYDDNNGGTNGDLLIQFNGQQITINDHFSNANSQVEAISFDGGSIYGYDLGSGDYAISGADPAGNPRIVNMSSSTANNFIAGENGNSDTITGGSGNDLIFGGGSSDTLTGGAGRDFISGGAGDDILIGGTGSDTLVGGSGDDTFKWNAGDLLGGGVDTIVDFESGSNGDVLDLSGLLSGIAANSRANAVRFMDSDGHTSLASQNGSATLHNGDLTLQVNLGSGWSDVAVIKDTGTNLTGGDDVIKMMLNNTQLQVHV